MSVLIKGMKMPKDGAYWCEINVAGDIALITIHGEDRKSFHLVELPDHGDLIDRDAYLNKLNTIEDDGVWMYASAASVSVMPVVIPAERSKDETD